MAAAVSGPVTHRGSVPKYELEFADGRRLDLDPLRPCVMGVVNITPDSFSDGGRWLEPEAAIEHALRLVDEGADVLDLGAESSRPGGGIYGTGAKEITADEELDRLLPVLERLRDLVAHPISIDTRKPETAERALDLGADLINDIGGLKDTRMLELMAARRGPVVIMHSRGELPTMQRNIDHRDVLAEVTAELAESADKAAQAGVGSIIVDPGIGFGKTSEHNLELVAGLARVAALGYPVLLGTSRKGYLGELTGRPPQERVAAGLATIGRALGSVHIVRVHDVAATVDFLKVWRAHDDPYSALRKQGGAETISRRDFRGDRPA